MATCPHCSKNTIAFLAGHLRLRPVALKCPACGGISHRTRKGHFLSEPFTVAGLAEVTVMTFGPIGWFLLIIWQRTWWAVILPAIALVAFLVWAECRRPLVAGPPQGTSNEERAI